MKKLILAVVISLSVVSIANAEPLQAQAGRDMAAAKAFASIAAHDADAKAKAAANNPGDVAAQKAALNALHTVQFASQNVSRTAKAYQAAIAADALNAKITAGPVSGVPTPQVVTKTTPPATINKPAGSLPAKTPVQTPTGVVPAGSLPPQTQVAVPHIPAIINSPVLKGGQQGHDHNHSSVGGSGNGANNAANSNSAHGLGGGNHIGGGSAQSGSRNVGHW